tara:strand:+ start:462 stop:1892 length:1431 start_codon:yes stop_codon:yes gene_type:complete
MNFNSEKYSLMEIKKMFNILDNVNFFNDFTLQDVELVKKKLYLYYKNEYPMRDKQIQSLLDALANRLIEERFAGSLEKPTSVMVKNTIKDNLNPNYKNTVTRVTEIDSQYRPILFQCNYPENCQSPYLSPASETTFSSKLTDTLNNTISLKVSAINIPFSFYNIETNQGNSVYTTSLSGEQYIDDGYYQMTNLISGLQTDLLELTYNYTNAKMSIKNNSGSTLTLTFYDNQVSTFEHTHINYSLGWILGFRNITCSGDEIYSSYTIGNNETITSEYISFIPTIKYFVITADDHNHNQSNKSLVQLSQGKEYIKPTPYYRNVNETDKYYRSNSSVYYSNSSPNTNTTINNDICGNICLDSLSRTNLSPWSEVYDNRKLTKKQLYTQAAINDTNKETQLKIEQHNMSNILAIIPFESKSLTWGQSIFFSDKNQYSREYHGPVDIEKLSIKIYDDKGHILNLNGQDWSMTLLSKHLYKY